MTHYLIAWRNGTMRVRRIHQFLPCAIRACPKRAMAKGFCDAHYYHYRRYGNALEPSHNKQGAKTQLLELHKANPRLNQAALAKLVGISKQRVSRILHGRG